MIERIIKYRIDKNSPINHPFLLILNPTYNEMIKNKSNDNKAFKMFDANGEIKLLYCKKENVKINIKFAIKKIIRNIINFERWFFICYPRYKL